MPDAKDDFVSHFRAEVIPDLKERIADLAPVVAMGALKFSDACAKVEREGNRRGGAYLPDDLDLSAWITKTMGQAVGRWDRADHREERINRFIDNIELSERKLRALERDGGERQI